MKEAGVANVVPDCSFGSWFLVPGRGVPAAELICLRAQITSSST